MYQVALTHPYLCEGHAPRRVMKIRCHLSYMLLACSFTVQELALGPAWERAHCSIPEQQQREMHNIKVKHNNHIRGASEEDTCYSLVYTCAFTVYFSQLEMTKAKR